MIDEHQDVDEQQPQEKLVLPAYPEQSAGSSSAIRKVTKLPTYLSSLFSSLSPLEKLRYLWHRDSAHRVLIVALALLLVTGLIFGTLVTSLLSQLSVAFITHNVPLTGLPQNAPTTPQGTIDFHPTFPTPGGGQGSTASSQPPSEPTPALQNTPSITPVPTIQPTPTQQAGQLSLRITSIPSQVINNSVVSVQVTANEPGVAIELYVTYNVPPGFYTSRARVTDGDGNVTLRWAVSVFAIGRRQALAHVVAVGQDQNGQQVSSQEVTVQIVGA
jgi:hypothetical protein